MAITGRPDSAPRVYPAPITTAADETLAKLRRLAPDPERLPANGAMLLGERARLLGLGRGGRVSANGSCRLLDAGDGRIALNLARPEDRDLLPAWLDGEVPDGWDDLAIAVGRWPVAALLERGIELGLPIAAEQAPISALPWILMPGGSTETGTPRVLDLSSLWAGPLAASLLSKMGADVIKVESLSRPDGARYGHAGFYDLLNAGKTSVSLDFAIEADRERLRALIARADIVIEGSRPRALVQLGIDAEAEAARGAIWISITAHGRTGDAARRVGFGDDAAIAGGLSFVMEAGWGEPLFAGDAIADPLAGINAALAGWTCWHARQGGLISISLADSARHALHGHSVTGAELAEWQAMAEADTTPLYPLRTSRPARAIGADNLLLASC